jgi:hypothetical protein
MKSQMLKFGDMPDGTHFEDGHGRKFIKLRLTFAAGGPFKCYRVVLGEDDQSKMQDFFNAVDYQGIGGKCPDWLEFKVISIP